MERAAGIAASYKVSYCQSHYDDACDRTATLIEEDIRQAITNPDQFITADKLIHKQIACIWTHPTTHDLGMYLTDCDLTLLDFEPYMQFCPRCGGTIKIKEPKS